MPRRRRHAAASQPSSGPPAARDERRRRLPPAARYVLAFAGAATVLFGLYQLTEATHRFAVVNRCNAALCGGVLRGVGVDAQRNGTMLRLPGGGMEIISECSAIYVAILFAAAVIAFPTTWRARLRGLAVGLPILFAVNLLRLATLGLVIRYRAALLPLFHEYLWQVLFVIVVTALYVAWIERIVPRATRPRSPA
jgi:exosortase H (IPTLxxWG-CTERM-specific)